MANDPFTYFGLWSGREIQRASDLLVSLQVRFETGKFTTTEEDLREWCAWDATSPDPYTGFNLWIHSDDLPMVGTKIVDMFPERKFGG